MAGMNETRRPLSERFTALAWPYKVLAVFATVPAYVAATAVIDWAMKVQL